MHSSPSVLTPRLPRTPENPFQLEPTQAAQAPASPEGDTASRAVTGGRGRRTQGTPRAGPPARARGQERGLSWVSHPLPTPRVTHQRRAATLGVTLNPAWSQKTTLPNKQPHNTERRHTGRAAPERNHKVPGESNTTAGTSLAGSNAVTVRAEVWPPRTPSEYERRDSYLRGIGVRSPSARQLLREATEFVIHDARSPASCRRCLRDRPGEGPCLPGGRPKAQRQDPTPGYGLPGARLI